MIFQRERLEVGVEIGAQLQKRLQADFHKEVIAREIGQAPEKLNADKRQAEEGNQVRRISETRIRISRQNIIHDDFKRPRLQQTQRDSAKRKNQAKERLAQKRSVILEGARVDRHWKFKIADAPFSIELTGCAVVEIPRLRSE